ncbi:hypothetical protein [Azospirillum halopraeferens]|uniref:hypothetical protein n=1 Tax=Azospirillum halopraeferens TaxID=34010 RepID=UPI00042875E7|nr:hypothetical protein [Azospirillum halopraeferens]
MAPLRRFARIGLLLPLLAACESVPPVVVAGTAAASAVSLTSTKKTLVDHAASTLTGMDCSFIGLQEHGRYCHRPMVVDRSQVYCYRTLADVDCHHIPDPFRNGQTALASPPPNLKPAAERGLFD